MYITIIEIRCFKILEYIYIYRNLDVSTQCSCLYQLKIVHDKNLTNLTKKTIDYQAKRCHKLSKKFGTYGVGLSIQMRTELLY